MTLSSGAVAQQTSTVMPAVTIVGEADGATYLAKRSASATKTDTPVLEAPQSLTVVTRDEMDARAVTSVLDVLRYMPGAVTETHGVDPRGYEYFNLRGFINAQNTSNYLNGLRQVPGGFGMFRSEPYGLERIEVLRGTGSVLFGQGDPGGTINRVSKLPGTGAANEVRVDAGSFSRRQLAADIGGAIGGSGALHYRVVGLRLDSDTQFDYGNGQSGRNERQYLAPSLLWSIAPGTTLTLLGEYTNDRSGSGRWTAVRPDGSLTHTMIGDPRFDQQENEQWSLGYQIEHQLNAGWTIRQNLRQARLRSVYNAINPGAVGNNIMQRTAAQYFSRVDNTLVDNQLQGKFNWAGAQHTVLAGLDWMRMEDSEYRVRGAAPAQNLLAPSYNVTIGPRTQVFGSLRDKLTQTGLYAQDQARFANGMILTVGGRYDKVEDTLQNFLTKATSRSDDSVLSGRVGLSYLVTPELAPYVCVGTSFLPQIGQDFSGKAFEPMKARQTEVGVKYQPANGKTLFTAALFDLSKTNVATNDPLHVNFSVLTGAQRARGVELEARGEVLRGLNITAAYSYNDVEVSRSNNAAILGKMPILVPTSSASVWGDYVIGGGALNGLGMGLGARYVGKHYWDQLNSGLNKEQTVFDAVAHYTDGRWRYALNVSNLTGKEYATCLAEPAKTCFWAPERTVQLSARYRW
ncbi:TonB-dependent siderophore receptor [Massilia mucilaginosa]|uniref:TonB-dependent siderophore receptor n=1 Tax=Massilia mucilaginosa TaxID=2609282 RepID=UPI001E4C3BAE|nr:TonB-dependent siderophore receptor [Massilia mucilaginosa]